MAHRPPSPTDPGERDPDDPLTTRRADVPASLALQTDCVLGHEHRPAPAWPGPDVSPMFGEGHRCAGNAQGDGVTQGTAIPRGFEAQSLVARDSVSAVQVEGHDVERPAVMLGAAAPRTSRRGRDPVRQLVEEGEPLVNLVGAGADRDQARFPSRHPARMFTCPSPPGQAWWEDVGIGADRGRELGCPFRRAHSWLSGCGQDGVVAVVPHIQQVVEQVQHVDVADQERELDDLRIGEVLM